MVSSIIVTVRFQNPQKQLDMELPCQLPVSQVRKELLAALKSGGFSGAKSAQDLELWTGSEKLRDDKSLAEADVWDGAVLTAKMT